MLASASANQPLGGKLTTYLLASELIDLFCDRFAHGFTLDQFLIPCFEPWFYFPKINILSVFSIIS